MVSAFRYKEGSVEWFLKESPGTIALIQQTTETVKTSAEGSYLAGKTSARPSPVKFRTEYETGKQRYRGAAIAVHPNPTTQQRIEDALAGAAGRSTQFKRGKSAEAADA